MPLTLSSDATDRLDLAAFVEHLERELDVGETDDLIVAAPAFKCLLNNHRLVAEVVEAELCAWRDGGTASEYVGRTIVLVRRPKFEVRANVWVVPDPHRPAPGPADPGFDYLVPHDHNFAFLTGGYHGPGYTTYLYEYDGAGGRGRTGKRAALRPLGPDTLPVGKMMLYWPSADVHYQDHPRALSISLNVVVRADYARRAQHLFDLLAGTVWTAADATPGRGVTIWELAAAVGDARTATLLGDVAQRAAEPHVRDAAARALNALA